MKGLGFITVVELDKRTDFWSCEGEKGWVGTHSGQHLENWDAGYLGSSKSLIKSEMRPSAKREVVRF